MGGDNRNREFGSRDEADQRTETLSRDGPDEEQPAYRRLKVTREARHFVPQRNTAHEFWAQERNTRHVALVPRTGDDMIRSDHMFTDTLFADLELDFTVFDPGAQESGVRVNRKLSLGAIA